MDDASLCPICGNKLKTRHHSNKILPSTGQISDYAEKICSEGHNHIVSFWLNKATKKIDFLKLSLSPKYSRFFEIDYVSQKCRITCMKDGEMEYIDIPKMIEPDFPLLTKLKEKVALYVTFS